MDAKELRIGNLILLDGKEYEITPRFFSMLAGGRSFEEQKTNTELNGCWQPIHLTEEWLVKFGFEIKKGEATIKSCNSLMLDTIDMACSFGGDYDIVDIKYVNQLQNLYFALTGEELF